MFLIDDRDETRAGSGLNRKPELDDDLLMHFGIKGMKWGFRKGSSKTGVSRARGALIDRNERYIWRTQKALKGKQGNGLLRDRAGRKLDHIVLGKTFTDRLYKVNIKEMRDQNARLKSGKATLRDKLAVYGHVNPANMFVSNRPKNMG